MSFFLCKVESSIIAFLAIVKKPNLFLALCIPDYKIKNHIAASIKDKMHMIIKKKNPLRKIRGRRK